MAARHRRGARAAASCRARYGSCRCCSRRCWRCGTRACGRCSWRPTAAAWTCWCAGERLAERLPLAALGADFELTGTVAGFPSEAPGQITFAFDVAAPRPPGVPPRVRLTWYDPPAGVGPGDALGRDGASTAAARRAQSRRLRLRAVAARQRLRRDGLRARPAPSTRPARGELETRWLGFRGVLAERIGAASSDADGAALLTALALGERFRFRSSTGRIFGARARATSSPYRACTSRCSASSCSSRCDGCGCDCRAARELRSRSCGRREPARDGLLRRADRASPCRRSVRSSWSPSRSRRSRAAAASSATQLVAATLVVVLVFDPFAPLVGVVLVVVRRRRDPAGARGAPAAGSRGRRAVCGAARAPRSSSLRLQWWIGFALLPLTAWYFGEVSLVGPLVNLVAIPFFNACLVPLTVLVTLAAIARRRRDLGSRRVVHAVAVLAGMTVRGSARRRRAARRGARIGRCRRAPALARRLRSAWRIAIVRRRRCRASRSRGSRCCRLRCRRCDLPPHGTARAVVLDVGHGLAVLVETRSASAAVRRGPDGALGIRQRRGDRLAGARGGRSPRSRPPHREPRRQRSCRRRAADRRRVSRASTC